MVDTSRLALTPEISALIAGALDSGNVLLLAAVDRQNRPVLSFRGSTAVYGPDQLSIWVRNAQGGTSEAIKDNPHVALMYRSPTTPMLQFTGRARLADGAERERAYALAHEKERAADPDRKGAALIIELDEVRGVLGFNAQGPIFVRLARE